MIPVLLSAISVFSDPLIALRELRFDFMSGKLCPVSLNLAEVINART